VGVGFFQKREEGQVQSEEHVDVLELLLLVVVSRAFALAGHITSEADVNIRKRLLHTLILHILVCLRQSFPRLSRHEGDVDVRCVDQPLDRSVDGNEATGDLFRVDLERSDQNVAHDVECFDEDEDLCVVVKLFQI